MFRTLIAAVAWLAAAPAAWAGPAEIEAGKMDFLHKENRAIFTEDVHLKRDDFELWCDRLVAYFVDNSLDHAEAFGHIRLKQGKISGTSEKATLDQKKGVLTLIGHAVLTQEGNRVEGETIIHNTRNERTVIKPAKGGRTHMTIENVDDNSLPKNRSQDGKRSKDKRAP